MKKIIFLLVISMVIVFSAEAHKYRRNHTVISIQTFYDELSPYGDWMYTPEYGYVWRPYFDHYEAFRPYSSNGHWVNTEYGWTWNSNYNWGWATFHYGRWDFNSYLGWLWIPGYEWAPAWVSWGYYDDYYGWAPLGPRAYVGVNSDWYAPDPWWTFVPRHRFCSSNWNQYIYDRPVRVTNINYITHVYDNSSTNNSWYYGPRVNEVERYTRSRVRTMKVVESRRSSDNGVINNRLNIYRPSVDNKRNDYRPTEFRSIEQTQSANRVQQTNARTNDPGVNRVREDRIINRNATQIDNQRNVKVVREPQDRTRNSNEIPNTRNAKEPRDLTPASRNQPKTNSRNDTRNNNVRVVRQPDSQSPATRSTPLGSPSVKREESQPASSPRETNRRSSNNGTNRTENAKDVQNRSSSPVDRINDTKTSEKNSRQTQEIQKTRVQKRNSSTENSQREMTEPKQTSRDTEQSNPNIKTTENPARNSVGTPTRR